MLVVRDEKPAAHPIADLNGELGGPGLAGTCYGSTCYGRVEAAVEVARHLGASEGLVRAEAGGTAGDDAPPAGLGHPARRNLSREPESCYPAYPYPMSLIFKVSRPVKVIRYSRRPGPPGEYSPGL